MPFTIDITNHIPELNLSPVNTVFSAYNDALTRVTEFSDAAVSIHDLGLVRSASKFTLFNGLGQECDIRVMSEHKGRPSYPIRFTPDDYLVNTYGLDDLVYGNSCEVDVPYTVVVFARQYADGNTVSFWTRDKVAFEESLAKKLIADPKAGVRKRKVLINRDGSVECECATDYFLIYTNKDCVIFQPSPEFSVCCACNLDTAFIVEAKFVFDDGIVVPLTKTYRIGGMGAVSIMDAFDDIHNALEWQLDDFIECFEESANIIVHDDGVTLIGASQENGYTELEFERDDRAGLEDIRRALVSLRVVAIAEKIRSITPTDFL